MNDYAEFADRARRAQAAMAAADCDWLFVSHSTDLLYLIGFTKRPSERLALLLLPREGRATMVVPGFEVQVFQPYASFFDVIGWEETEDPVAKVAGVVGAGAGQTIAIADQLHTVFTLRLQAALAGARYIEGNRILASIRMIKTAAEIDHLRGAAARTEDALASLFAEPVTGKTEREVLRFLHNGLTERGLELSGGGIVGAGPHSASPHHKTGEARLADGDALVIDFGGGWNGYRSDLTRSFHVGEPPEEFRRVPPHLPHYAGGAATGLRGHPARDKHGADRLGRARELYRGDCLEILHDYIEPKSVDLIYLDPPFNSTSVHITAQGYGPAFIHRTGHGVGMDGHEYPYLIQGDTTVVEEGMYSSSASSPASTWRASMACEKCVGHRGRGRRDGGRRRTAESLPVDWYRASLMPADCGVKRSAAPRPGAASPRRRSGGWPLRSRGCPAR